CGGRGDRAEGDGVAACILRFLGAGVSRALVTAEDVILPVARQCPVPLPHRRGRPGRNVGNPGVAWARQDPRALDVGLYHLRPVKMALLLDGLTRRQVTAGYVWNAWKRLVISP